MFPRSVGALIAVVIAYSVSAEDSVLLRFAGRGLTPGDKFTVSSTVQYGVFDPNREAPTGPDGAKAIEESMAEFRGPSEGKALWTLTVPKDGRYSGKEYRLPFRNSIKVIPGRITTYLVTVVVSRSTVTPDGKPASFTRELTFPIMISEGSIPKDLCVVFEGASGGMLNMGVRSKCSESVAPKPGTRSIPAQVRD